MLLRMNIDAPLVVVWQPVACNTTPSTGLRKSWRGASECGFLPDASGCGDVGRTPTPRPHVADWGCLAAAALIEHDDVHAIRTVRAEHDRLLDVARARGTRDHVHR